MGRSGIDKPSLSERIARQPEARRGSHRRHAALRRRPRLLRLHVPVLITIIITSMIIIISIIISSIVSVFVLSLSSSLLVSLVPLAGAALPRGDARGVNLGCGQLGSTLMGPLQKYARARPGTFGRRRVGEREYILKKSLSVKNNKFAVAPLVLIPFVPFRASQITITTAIY